MKTILLLFILFIVFDSWGQRVNISELTVSNDTYSSNGSSYNGSVYVLYVSGQLKEEFQVKNGKVEGIRTLFYSDNAFKKEKYQDTLMTKFHEGILDSTKSVINQVKKDSVESLELKNNYYNQIGGWKKYNKYSEKYIKGKLKKDKLTLFQNYQKSEKQYNSYTKRLKRNYSLRDSFNLVLIEEKNKPVYSNKVHETYEYLNGKLTGAHKLYDSYGRLILEEELKDGLKNGSFKKYENGQIKEEGTYLDDKKNGEWKLYSYNGKEILNYVNDLKDGIYKKYIGDILIEDGVYSNGLMNGAWVFRYDNGNLKGKGKFIDGKLEGDVITYYNSGEIEWKVFNIHGKRDQTKKTTRYYKNGNIWYEGFAGDGDNEWYGEFKKYHANGKLMEISNYDMSGNGKILSKKNFDKNGNQIDSKLNRSFKDSRDGKEYKTIEIGTQFWMAENLAFEPKNGSYNSYFNDGVFYGPARNDLSFANDLIEKYGYLYDWNAAKEVCPQGWHLPDNDDWEILKKSLGTKAGIKMKSSSGWNEFQSSGGENITCSNCVNWNYEYRRKVACHVCQDTRITGKMPVKKSSGNGTNESGFNGLPGGMAYVHYNKKSGLGSAEWTSWYKNGILEDFGIRDDYREYIMISEIKIGNLGRYHKSVSFQGTQGRSADWWSSNMYIPAGGSYETDYLPTAYYYSLRSSSSELNSDKSDIIYLKSVRCLCDNPQGFDTIQTNNENLNFNAEYMR